MPAQKHYPESWSRDCPNKGMKVEIALYDTPATSLATFENTTFDWIEIPTSKVELWETKSDGPHITKNAKVTFPTEFDGRDVRSLVKGYGVDSPSYGRVWVKDERGNWVLDHCGYIASVGPRENELESKCWIYDMSYLFDAIPITATYNNVTVDTVLRDVAERIEQNLVPLSGVSLLHPDGDEVFLRSATQLATDTAVPRRNSSYYGYELSERETELGNTDIERISIDETPNFPSLPFADTLEDLDALFNPIEFAEEVTARAAGIEDEPIDRFFQTAIKSVYQFLPELGAKKFTANHDTVGDVLKWLSEKTGLRYHFEPTARGVTLVITAGPMRRTFVQDTIVDDLQDGTVDPQDFQSRTREYYAHESVTVRNNQALYEIAPANKVIVKGDTKRSILGKEVDIDATLTDVPVSISERDYPVAEAVAEPLVDAAGGTELPLVVESDVTTIDEARQEAITTLQDHLDRSSEGNIRLDGMPRALPYDVLDAYETCNEYVTEQLPVRYEIETIKHTDSMTSTLETKLNVQAFVGEESIDTNVREETVEE